MSIRRMSEGADDVNVCADGTVSQCQPSLHCDDYVSYLCWCLPSHLSSSSEEIFCSCRRWIMIIVIIFSNRRETTKDIQGGGKSWSSSFPLLVVVVVEEEEEDLLRWLVQVVSLPFVRPTIIVEPTHRSSRRFDIRSCCRYSRSIRDVNWLRTRNTWLEWKLFFSFFHFLSSRDEFTSRMCVVDSPFRSQRPREAGKSNHQLEDGAREENVFFVFFFSRSLWMHY